MIKEQAERDKAAAKLRRDSIAKIKHDTIVARRLAKMAEQRRKDEAKAARIKLEQERRRRLRIDKAKAKAARKGVEYTGEEYATDTLPADSLAADSLAADSLRAGQMPDTLARDSMSLDSLSADTLDMEGAIADSIPADSVYRQIKAYRNVKMYRTDSQMICDSLVTMNTDSIIHLYIDPILWNETNQVTSDYMDIYTANQMIVRAEFIDRPYHGGADRYGALQSGQGSTATMSTVMPRRYTICRRTRTPRSGAGTDVYRERRCDVLPRQRQDRQDNLSRPPRVRGLPDG